MELQLYIKSGRPQNSQLVDHGHGHGRIGWSLFLCMVSVRPSENEKRAAMLMLMPRKQITRHDGHHACMKIMTTIWLGPGGSS